MPRAQGEADVHVVVVMSEGLNDAPSSVETCGRPHEDVLSPRAHEAVDEVLGQLPIDLVGRPRGSLSSVTARVVHVHIEPVLMRGVPQSPEPRPEAPASGTADISYADADREGVLCRVRAQHSENGPDEAIVAEAPRAAVG